jgi:hypothetical protein
MSAFSLSIGVSFVGSFVCRRHGQISQSAVMNVWHRRFQLDTDCVPPAWETQAAPRLASLWDEQRSVDKGTPQQPTSNRTRARARVGEHTSPRGRKRLCPHALMQRQAPRLTPALSRPHRTSCVRQSPGANWPPAGVLPARLRRSSKPRRGHPGRGGRRGLANGASWQRRRPRTHPALARALSEPAGRARHSAPAGGACAARRRRTRAVAHGPLESSAAAVSRLVTAAFHGAPISRPAAASAAAAAAAAAAQLSTAAVWPGGTPERPAYL